MFYRKWSQWLVLLAILACSLFGSCSRHYYYAPSLKEAQPVEMPVMEPYTDITIYQKTFKEQTYSDSLSAIAHRALLDVIDGDTLWNLKRLHVKDAEKYRAAVLKWARECRASKSISEVDVPDVLLDYMKEADEPYLMFIIQKGYERDKDFAKSFWGWPDTDSNGAALSFEALVADSNSQKTAFYNKYSQTGTTIGSYKKDGMKPTDSKSVEICLHQLLRNYPDRQTNASYLMEEKPRTIFFLNPGLGLMYSDASSANRINGMEPSYSVSADVLFSPFRSPFCIGFGINHIQSFASLKRSGHSDHLQSGGLEIGYSRVFGTRHSLTLVLGAHYSVEKVWLQMPGEDESERSGKGFSGQASLMYQFRINEVDALGIKLNAQSLFHESPLANPNSKIDNCLIAISYMSYSFLF